MVSVFRSRVLIPQILFPRVFGPLVLFALAVAAPPPLAAAPTDQGQQGKGQTDEEEEAPTQAPLTVGSMAIASDSALTIEGMAVDVAVDKVTYAYRLRNKDATKLTLAASLAMPDLEVNSEGSTVYALPSKTAENPIDLQVKADDKVIATTPFTQAIALGIDRLADLKAAQMPLVPFGEEIDKALTAAKPDVLSKLESLGLVTPRDPKQPDTPVIADWSLHTVQGWSVPIDPNATTNVTVAFAPIKAVYTVDVTSLPGFDALKQQVCLTPAIMSAAKALLKTKGATMEVVDITLANDGPARWLDNPVATVAVRKPKPTSIVAFCGVDQASTNQPVVKGTMPGSGDAAGLRVLVFSPTAP